MAINYLRNLSQSMPNCFINKEECIYTPQYCEENIWMLTNKIKERFPDMLKCCYPTFISNESRLIPIYKQAASSYEDGFIVWDYHVVLLFSTNEETWVFDFDSQLSFPSKFDEYCDKTFKPGEILSPKYNRFFRVIPAKDFLNYFSSDRRHMKSEDGTWKKPPPNYPAIRNSDDVHNLDQYISMTGSNSNTNGKFGQVLSLNKFIEMFSKNVRSGQNELLDYKFPPEPAQPSWLE